MGRPFLQDEDKIAVFVSYAQEDVKLREAFIRQVVDGALQDVVHFWLDDLMDPGTEWRSEIDRRLQLSPIIVLLVTRGFLASGVARGG